MHAPLRRWTSLSLACFVLAAPSWAQSVPVPNVVSQFFETDPLADSETILEGDALSRLTWNDDPALFPGDRPGSLTALYDSRMAPGRIGWALPSSWNETDPFRATAIFVIEPDGFTADPFGFFQISWGLWSSRASGLERTGSFTSFAADTFELLEFGYFPNVSPFFGGPFLSPSAFGVADRDDPSFDLLGAFTNFAFGSVAADLPLGVPLAATISHRPRDEVVVVTVERIDATGRRVPVPGAVAVVRLTDLPVRDYAFDTVGLLLWHDGFGGESPSLRAEVVFHLVSAAPAVRVDR